MFDARSFPAFFFKLFCKFHSSFFDFPLFLCTTQSPTPYRVASRSCPPLLLLFLAFLRIHRGNSRHEKPALFFFRPAFPPPKQPAVFFQTQALPPRFFFFSFSCDPLFPPPSFPHPAFCEELNPYPANSIFSVQNPHFYAAGSFLFHTTKPARLLFFPSGDHQIRIYPMYIFECSPLHKIRSFLLGGP